LIKTYLHGLIPEESLYLRMGEGRPVGMEKSTEETKVDVVIKQEQLGYRVAFITVPLPLSTPTSSTIQYTELDPKLLDIFCLNSTQYHVLVYCKKRLETSWLRTGISLTFFKVYLGKS
jgi:hypothetical protein